MCLFVYHGFVDTVIKGHDVIHNRFGFLAESLDGVKLFHHSFLRARPNSVSSIKMFVQVIDPFAQSRLLIFPGKFLGWQQIKIFFLIRQQSGGRFTLSPNHTQK